MGFELNLVGRGEVTNWRWREKDATPGYTISTLYRYIPRSSEYNGSYMRWWIGVKMAQRGRRIQETGGGLLVFAVEGSTHFIRSSPVQFCECHRETWLNCECRVREIVLSMVTAMDAMADSFTFRPDHECRDAVSSLRTSACHPVLLARIRGEEKGCRRHKGNFVCATWSQIGLAIL